MSTGRIVVALTSNNRAQPVTDAEITVLSADGRVVNRQVMVGREDGKSDPVTVDAPDIELSLEEESAVLPYAVYDVVIKARGYYGVTIKGVQVFADRTALMESDIVALPDGSGARDVTVEIPTHRLFEPEEENRQEYDNKSKVLSRVVIPDVVTVHLGRPNESARNVTVGFADYIKNVCCSEIYSTWPTEALKANILAQISLVLNRVYTEWYRSRGYNFDITNSTAYDQYFVYGRNIEQNVSNLVDSMFTKYVRKVGTVNPYYTEYCDGSTVTCPGMKQWGTVTLAQNGYSALQILQYYYGSDIEIVESEVVDGAQSSYPGSPLAVGSSGTDVSTVQRQLARIAQNYPSIGEVPVDGVYGAGTEAAVKRFQSIFGITSDGVVGSATWYKLSFIYVAVKKLAELSSEGETYAGDGSYPGTALRIGSRGSAVSSLQYYINFIANSIEYIPSVSIDGIYGNATASAVRQFQDLYGLSVDGVVGRITWNEIYNAYKGIMNNAEIAEADDYPGTPLRVGSRGSDVLLMQQYINYIAGVYTDVPRLSPDGVYGGATANSVRILQGLFGLTADGVIGRITWELIVNLRTGLSDLAYGGTVLRRGSSGIAVIELQTMLNRIADEYGTIGKLAVDGSFGAATEASVRAFQSIFGLSVDGAVGARTWNELLRRYFVLLYNDAEDSDDYPGSPLYRGSSGDAVAHMQRYINFISNVYTTVPKLTADGIYGSGTENSVAVLQRIFGLAADGVIGKETWDLIVALERGLSENEYGGTSLTVGATGESVEKAQMFLNYVAHRYASIPSVTVDGIFGEGTRASVVAFQNVFGLSADGIIGKNTWNAILREYYKLYFTNDESDDVYPGSPLSVGSTGAGVVHMQRYLNYIADIYSVITPINVDGVYGAATAAAVTAFQELFDTSADGVIGAHTWNLIVDVYRAIADVPYGGTVLRAGSEGGEVRKLQEMLSVIAETEQSIPSVAADGVYGADTEAAVTAFQRFAGLTPDGETGAVTWDAVVGEYILLTRKSPRNAKISARSDAAGSPVSDVLSLQKKLGKLSVEYGTDGVFSEKNKKRVENFRCFAGLSENGAVDEKTREGVPNADTPSLSESAGAPEKLVLGSESPEVLRYQKLINRIAEKFGGIERVEENGVYGFAVFLATKALQRLLAREETGAADAEFIALLERL